MKIFKFIIIYLLFFIQLSCVPNNKHSVTGLFVYNCNDKELLRKNINQLLYERDIKIENYTMSIVDTCSYIEITLSEIPPEPGGIIADGDLFILIKKEYCNIISSKLK